jgi:Uma2 family endonuclease
MSILSIPRATLDDLYRAEGNAELIGGRITRFKPSGHLSGSIAEEIFISLKIYSKSTGRGIAHADGVGFAVPELPSGRESFSPDASYYTGPLSANPMRFIAGPPTFAVEVRSENDYGNAAELAMADKRADYFTAGTLVAWDVDPQAETVTVYRADKPAQPTFCRQGETADAEPAVPGWTMKETEMFAAQ